MQIVRILVQRVVVVALVTTSCKKIPTPKPKGYFRIDFPEKKYQTYSGNCPYQFEFPTYGCIESVNVANADECWFNIAFPAYRAKLHLTYKPLNNNLATHIEDVRTLVYKHIVKADDIQENIIIGSEEQVYGIIYELSGNTASAATFFVTDSLNHFLTGSLYFSTSPNKDSLAPAIRFFQEDIVHLTKSLTWK
jgi:gliding motility-associated lipoprotein GldD